MSKVITAPGVLKNVQGQIDHVTDMYDDIKDNNLKPLTITLDAVSNANGAYSHTTSDDRITEDMKPVTLEVGTPECFYAPVVVTTGSGTATVTCEDAHGNSTITVTFVKTSPVEGGEDYPPAVTSTEFDILADRIGSLSSLDTTVKTSTVAAINEVVGNIGTVPSGKTVEGQIDDINSKITTQSISTGITGVTARKTGNVVMLKIIATAPSSKGWFTIGNLPSELRPAYDFYTSIPLVNTDNSIAQLQITASEGITKVYNPNTTANSVNGAIMYVTAS